MATVLKLYVANLREFTRDRLALFWTLAFPVLFIVLFGLIFSGNNSASFNVALVNQAGASDTAAASIVTAFSNVKPFKIKPYADVTVARSDLQAGKEDLVIVIPAGLGQALQANQTTGIQVIYDPSNQTNAQIELGIVQSVLTGINQQATGRAPLVQIAPQQVQTHQINNISYLVPGIMAMALMQLGIIATVGPLVALRQQQVLRRLGATPLPRWQLLTGQVLLRLTIALAQTGLLLGIGSVLFGVSNQGNPLALAGLALLGAAAFISLGYLIASVAPTVESATGITQAINFPMMFLSGIFFPLAILPVFLTPIVRILPLTYLGDAFRQVMIGSVPAFPLTTDIAVLAGWAIVCTGLAVRFFRWE